MGGKGLDTILKHFEKWANFSKGNEEDLICAEIVGHIRQYILRDEFDGIFFHVENETGGKRTALYNMIKKVTGKIPGVPDYVFMRQGKAFMIEIKAEKGFLNKNQKIFHKWCEKYNVPVFVCRSWEEVKKILIDNNYICV